jgi:hypothetical protein
MQQIEDTNLYLCLSILALIKDRITQEQNELKKLKNEVKQVR